MKKLTVIIFILSSLTLLGQSTVDFCASGIKKANERLSRGQIYFPRYIFDSSITLRKMLELEYGIKDDLYSEYCVSFMQELECHDSLMTQVIANKWGADFLIKQRQLADKLESEGKGYMTPSNPDAEKGIHQLLLQSYEDNGIRYKRFKIDLVISTTGKIVKQEIHTLSEGVVADKELEIINSSISKYSDNWTPGGLKGQPIEMTTSIEVGKYVTGPK